MVKISGKTNYSPFARPADEDVGSYAVLGDEPARVVCVDSPVRPRPESYMATRTVGLGGVRARERSPRDGPLTRN